MTSSSASRRRSGWLPLAGLLAVACSPGASPTDAGSPDGGPADAGPPPRPDAGPRDAGVDANACGATSTLCGGSCVDTATDPAHCGGCDVACDAPADASPTCDESSCGFACDPGFAEVGGACLPAPRPLWPPSLSTSVSQAPAFRWALPTGLTDATLELCADRACATVIESIDVTGEEARPTAALPAGSVFWRVTSDGRSGPTWQVRIGVASIDADRAWGVYPDYDGDGFGDVVVGAPRVADSEGRAYAYLGGPAGTSASPDTILRSPDGAGAEHALALACAGDLDADGYADLAIGAPRADGTAGRVHLYFGGPDGFSATPDRALEAPAGAGSLFGGAVAGVGDVDGDGYGDLLVGALGEGVTPGRAYLFGGGPRGPADAPTATLTGSGRFASAVAGAGDVDGDGFADVLIGAYGVAASAGAVHLFVGSAAGLVEPAARVYAGTDGDGAQFGFSVAGLGDVNGDGYADFAAGAPATDGSRGRVHVFHGRDTDPPDVPAASIDGVNAGGGFFGHAVAGFGDGNADGYADVAIGAFGVDGRRGRLTVLVGSATGLVTTARTQLAGLGTEHDFGWAVASAGDMDGNGRADLIVGAPGVDGRMGRAYIHRGAAAGAATTAFVALVGASGGAFGRAL